MHIGKAKIATGVAIGKAFVIEAEQMQKGRVKVMDVNAPIDGLETEVVGGTVDLPTLDAATREPHRKAPVIMVAAVDPAGIRTWRRQFHGRRAPEFPAPNHQRAVQHAALLEVLEQGANRPVTLSRQTTMVDFKIVMVVPGLTRPVPQLQESNPFFEQTPGDEELPCLHTWTIHIANVFRFAADIEGILGVPLHSIRELKGLNACFQLGVRTTLVKVALIEPLQQVKLLPLLAGATERLRMFSMSLSRSECCVSI